MTSLAGSTGGSGQAFAAFDGARTTSDAGLLLLAAIERGEDRTPGHLHRRPARSGAGPARAFRDDPLPGADHGGLS